MILGVKLNEILDEIVGGENKMVLCYGYNYNYVFNFSGYGSGGEVGFLWEVGVWCKKLVVFVGSVYCVGVVVVLEIKE